jgi:hypothetical protein
VIRSARWAAAVLLLGSAIALVSGIFAFSLAGADRTVSTVAVVVGACGIVTGIGLLRLWRWARISALIVGAVYAYVGFALTPMIPFFQFPIPPDLREQVTTEAATETEMRIKIILIVVFFIVGAIGFWWAYLFSSGEIKERFGSLPTTRSRPFKFSVVGWYFVITAILGIWSLWRGVQHSPLPIMVFGSLLIGWSALIVRALYVTVHLCLGVGLLRRGDQSRRFAIYYLLFECLNVIVFLLRSGREARIAVYHDMLSELGPTFGLYFSTASWSHYMRAASIEWAILSLITIWFLVKQNHAPNPAKS